MTNASLSIYIAEQINHSYMYQHQQPLCLPFYTYALAFKVLPFSTISSMILLNSCLSSIGTT